MLFERGLGIQGGVLLERGFAWIKKEKIGDMCIKLNLIKFYFLRQFE